MTYPNIQTHQRLSLHYPGDIFNVKLWSAVFGV